MKFSNGLIYTMAGPGQHAQSIRIEGAQVASLNEPGTGIDLGGRTILPGFTDAHTHFYYWARTRDQIDLDGVPSLAEALSRVKVKAEVLPAGTWLCGRGFNKNSWSPAQFPTRYDLDRHTLNHPTALYTKDTHALWVNSKALQVAGITSQTSDPPGGSILRDDSGEPTGMLFEKACELVNQVIPTQDPTHSATQLERAAEAVHQLGVTAIHDMGELDAWLAYRAWMAPSLDLVQYLRVEQLAYVEREELKSGDGELPWIFAGLKLFTDGALGSQTAHMWEPYEGSHSNTGVERLTPAQLKEHLDYAEAHGLACAIHAIGDRANSEVIAQAATHPARKLRHRIEHAQSVRPKDVAPLAASGWIASMQPSHLVSDRDMSLTHWGAQRSTYAFPMASFKRAGVPLAFGSDVPIEPVDPLFGIYAACCRRRPGDERGPWEPDERVDRYTAVRAFTHGAAWAAALETKTGTLEPGRRANLIILDRDLLEVPEEEILKVRVLATIQSGKVRYINKQADARLAETLAPYAV